MNDRVYYKSKKPPVNSGGFLDKEEIISEVQNIIDQKISKLDFANSSDFDIFTSSLMDVRELLKDKVNKKDISNLTNDIDILDRDVKVFTDLNRIRTSLQHKGVFNFNSAVNIIDNPAIETSNCEEGNIYWDFINKRLRIFDGSTWKTIPLTNE